jgi:hypothetical protein
VQRYVRAAGVRAASDWQLVASIPDDVEAPALLRDAIVERGRWAARPALWAASLLASRREAMQAAIERIDGSPSLRANAMETLEALSATGSLVPLLALWEPAPVPDRDDGAWLATVLADEDELIQRCAELVRARREGAPMTRSPTTTSAIERVLILRQVPLFADLGPSDLERIARIAEEQGFADGEAIAREGESGDDLQVVTDGVLRVVTDLEGPTEREIARRGAGEVVGEISLITQSPRVASLVADGPVRTLRIGHRAFESMVRERPELALGVIRVLALRLAESTRGTELADPTHAG